ncbi:AAA family ATPase [Colwellia sp. BRX8-7]|uniref:P-loop NTPase fold protein n=1 Tax=Colwellia sp. BRX8-7 TaxID=2759833 RepID=UPI0015F51CDE|nr:P-loop NTPase fold protein [Colwellia sp. BRX8-7]MBA6336659.1 AAA family ATPase [Colwellia sp. BRX8-7]
MEKLVLNVDSGEFTGEYKNDNELWQSRAYELAISNIERLVKESKIILKNNERSVNKTLSRVHDALFVFGDRGTGKTVFLYNLAKQWKQHQEKKSESNCNVLFLDIIDPTLLINNDNFVNVVIAHIHGYMQKEINASTSSKADYYHILGTLAESLGQSEYNSRDAGGLDRILSYQSSMDLESNFHLYIEFCISFLKKDAIVLLIDDVDMSMNKSHEVLETIRRLLSCPQIIPVVCGDKSIYQKILIDHFAHASNSQYQKRVPIDPVTAEYLADQYLLKVFPEHLRIGLTSITSLIPKIQVHLQKGEITDLNEFVTVVNSWVSPLINGEENSHSFPIPITSRKLVQFVQKFSDYVYAIKSKSNINKSSFWVDFMHYSETSSYGRGYLTATAEEQLIEQPFLLPSSLALFNTKAQSVLLTHNQSIEFNIIQSRIFDDFNVLETKENPNADWFNSQRGMLNSVKGTIGDTIIPMPPIEFYKYNLFISRPSLLKATGKEVDKNVQSNLSMLVSLFTHSNYYGTAKYMKHQLFFGKAFELFMFSVIHDFDAHEGERLLQKLKKNPPMHSIYSLTPTKTIDSDEVDSKDENESEGQDEIDTLDSLFSPEVEGIFIRKVIQWRYDNDQVLKEAKNKGLTTLFSFVFNKVFTQLHLMKKDNTFTADPRTKEKVSESENKKYSHDNLFHVARRFEFVLLSALGSFLKDKGVVAIQNTAKTRYSDNLMLPQAKNLDRAYKVNVLDFIHGEASKNQALMEAFTEHPIFKLSDNYNQKSMRDWLYIGTRPKGSNSNSDNIRKTRREKFIEKFDEIIVMDGDVQTKQEALLNLGERNIYRFITQTQIDKVFEGKTELKTEFIERIILEKQNVNSKALRSTWDARLDKTQAIKI